MKKYLYKVFKYLFFFSLLLNLYACNSKADRKKANFYHWKINAELEDNEKKAIETAQSDKVFLHYFDVVQDDDYQKPVAVVRKVGAVLKTKEIIPVIFIENSIFKSSTESKYSRENRLVKKIIGLTKQIHQHHFHKFPTEIQIDCDWTQTTKKNYFEFLSALKKRIKVSTTIRLHQIKYPDKTGVPPVDYGTLMLYNVGDLQNENQNSILSQSIVSQYISYNTKYPLNLDVALPIFSQAVITNNRGTLKLVNQANFDMIKNDSEHFEKETETVYKVKKKILYKGQYLYEGFKLKIEESNIEEIVKSYEIIKNSSLTINDVILYHLDEETLSEFKLQELLEKLK